MQCSSRSAVPAAGSVAGESLRRGGVSCRRLRGALGSRIGSAFRRFGAGSGERLGAFCAGKLGQPRLGAFGCLRALLRGGLRRAAGGRDAQRREHRRCDSDHEQGPPGAGAGRRRGPPRAGARAPGSAGWNGHGILHRADHRSCPRKEFAERTDRPGRDHSLIASFTSWMKCVAREEAVSSDAFFSADFLSAYSNSTSRFMAWLKTPQ